MMRAIIGLLCLVASARADVRLPDVFSDHCVLQRSAQTTVWGSATPGEVVQVNLGSVVSSDTTADESGRWQVKLNLEACEEGPFDLRVTGSNTFIVKDVLIGDVWIASGQSNMEFKLSQSVGGSEEVKQSANPRLRYFLPHRQAEAKPAETLKGKWVVASPETSGAFSAVAWFFAKAVQSSQSIPIGLIDTSWGGTPAEAWISSEGLDTDSELKPRKDTLLAQRAQAAEDLQNFPQVYKDWETKFQRKDEPKGVSADFTGTDVSTDDWAKVKIPGSLPGAGAFWLRTEVDIPPNRAGTYLPLMLGTIHDFEAVFWNGKEIGKTTPTHSTSINPDLTSTTNRRYDVPGNLVKPGKNTLAIRLFSPAGNAGIDAEHLWAGWNIPLDGQWAFKTEYELPPLSAEALSSYPRRPPWPVMPHYTATYLSNGMVNPLSRLTLRGVIWYQGEGNVGRAAQYRTTFPLVIKDWRQLFGRQDLPFYFCQIANFGSKKAVPAESSWAELRESQSAALSLADTGMATLIDVGEEEDIHFRDKKDAGLRLAAIALAKTYGERVPYSGPTLVSSEIVNNRIQLRFSHAEGGLVARPLPEMYQPKSSFPATKPLTRLSPGSELEGFAICGENGQWKWADAKIEGDTVWVWSESVPNPKFVRYAWADNPTCNLYNAAGFPAVPFRTDSLPLVTANRKY